MSVVRRLFPPAAALLAVLVPATAIAETETAASTTASRSDPDERVRCKRIAVTGSLVRVEKSCKTVAEWRRLSERGNDVVRAQWESGLICSGGQCRGIEP